MAQFFLNYQDNAGGPSVEITTLQQPDMVAPAQVWFTATNHTGLAPFFGSGVFYDGAHHEYEHEWTIDGQPLARVTHLKNLQYAHNNPNKAFGKKVPFLFDKPGVYTVTLTVRDRLGNTVNENSEEITVNDPETFFPEEDRIYVDNTGEYDGVPAASGKVQTLEALRTEMASRTNNPTWVLLKRGQEHTLTGVNLAHENDNFKGVLLFDSTTEVRAVSAYGTGSKPVITPDTRPDRAFTKNMFSMERPKTGKWRTINGIEFRAYYNPETEHGFCTYTAGVGIENWDVADGFSVIHDIKVSGLSNGVRPGGALNGDAHHQVVSHIVVDGWKDFAAFGGQPGQHLGFIACSFVQKPNTPNHGTKDNIRTTHGPIRISNSAYVYMRMMDLFSRNHWDGHDQPCLRLFTRPEAVQTAVVERCTMEGGFEVIHLINSENSTIYPANILLDRLLLIASTYSSALVNSQRSGVTLRNSVLQRPNVPMLAPAGNAGAINFTRTGNAPDETEHVYNHPVACYQNTYVNLLDDTNDGVGPYPDMTTAEGFYTQVIEENNVHYRPNGGTTVIDAAPIDVTTKIPDFNSRYLGRRYNFEYPEITLGSDVAPGETVSIPYTSITTNLYDGPSGVATNQAYWQALIGIDDDHLVRLENGFGPRRYYASQGHIDVSFADATNVIITNSTDETWPANTSFALFLDRASLMPEMDTQYATPNTMPLPHPLTGSSALASATIGARVFTAFDMTVRPATPSKGALELPVAAELTAVSVGAQALDKSIPITIQSNKATNVKIVTYAEAEAKPGLADFAGNATYTLVGTVSVVPGTDSMDLTIPEGLGVASRKFAMLPDYGTASDIIETGAITFNSLAPVGPQKLSEPFNVIQSASAFTTAPIPAFTPAAGTDRLMVLMVSYTNNSPAPTAITALLDGQTFELAGVLASTSNAIAKAQVLFLRDADIPEGEVSGSITFDNSVSDATVSILELGKVDQDSPIGANYVEATLSFEATTDAPLTTTADNSLVLSLFTLTGTGSPAPEVTTNTANELFTIQEHDRDSGYGQGIAAYEVVPTSGTAVTHVAEWVGNTRWGLRILEIKEAA